MVTFNASHTDNTYRVGCETVENETQTELQAGDRERENENQTKAHERNSNRMDFCLKSKF